MFFYDMVKKLWSIKEQNKLLKFALGKTRLKG